MAASFPSRAPAPTSSSCPRRRSPATRAPGTPSSAASGSCSACRRRGPTSRSWRSAAGCCRSASTGSCSRVVPSRGLRALAAFVAAQPSTLYGYALVGGIKELTTATALVFCAAIVSSIRPREDGVRGLLPLAIGVAALMGTFSITIGPWLAVLLILAVAGDGARAQDRHAGSRGRLARAAVVDRRRRPRDRPGGADDLLGDPAREGRGGGPGPGRDGPHRPRQPRRARARPRRARRVDQRRLPRAVPGRHERDAARRRRRGHPRARRTGLGGVQARPRAPVRRHRLGRRPPVLHAAHGPLDPAQGDLRRRSGGARARVHRGRRDPRRGALRPAPEGRVVAGRRSAHRRRAGGQRAWPSTTSPSRRPTGCATSSASATSSPGRARRSTRPTRSTPSTSCARPTAART